MGNDPFDEKGKLQMMSALLVIGGAAVYWMGIVAALNL